MATYNKAHNILPYQESFHYFDLDNTQSIEDAIRSSINSPQRNMKILKIIQCKKSCFCLIKESSSVGLEPTTL